MELKNTHELLAKTRQFWNTNPCDGQDSLQKRSALRYGKDPWLLDRLSDIGKERTRIVEIGCGQATDALSICANMAKGGTYLGLDYSDDSIASAQKATEEAIDSLNVIPTFRHANAENLDFESDSIDYVYSFGVLHHSPNTQKTIDEVYRILRPGGVAEIALYRTLSPKLLIAHFLRGFQWTIDRLTGGDGALLSIVRRFHLESLMGTALLECFGVPILRSYTADQMRHMFQRFEILELTPCGNNLPQALGKGGRGQTPPGRSILGVFFWIKVRKPIE